MSQSVAVIERQRPLPLRPSRFVLAAVYVVFAAEFTQALVSNPYFELVPAYVGLHLVFLILFTAVLWRPAPPSIRLHLCFALQSLIVTALLLLNPELGTVTALFVLLAFQVAAVLTDASRWVWVGVFAVLIAGPLMLHLGTLNGLARAILPVIGSFILAGFVTVTRETEAARAQSQSMLTELEAARRQLQAYADEAQENAALEERSRMARELHDSVSQTLFSIVLHTRSAELLLTRDPVQVRPQLEQLQQLAQNALAEMRGLIVQWRPDAG